MYGLSYEQRLMMRPSSGIFFVKIVCFILVLLVLAGCGPLNNKLVRTKLYQGGARTSPRINVFLTLKDDKGPALRLEVASLEILADDLWLPLTEGPITLDSISIGKGQLFLGAQNVAPGSYERLRLTVNKGSMKRAEGEEYHVVAFDSVQIELPLSSSVDLDPEDSSSLLLTWDTESSLLPGPSLHPAMTAVTPVGELPVNLVFVTCPEIDTMFVIRTDKNWVVDSFGLKGSPSYVAINSDSPYPQLYILTPGDREIKVVDLFTYRTKEFVKAPLNDRPTFMAISPNGRTAFLLDEKSGYLSRIDMVTGGNTARIQLGYRPKFLTYLKEQNLLAVSLSLSQQVLLLEPQNLGTIARISTGRAPFGITISGDLLYVAESQDETVSVIDLTTRRKQGQIFVGLGPLYLQEANNQIYVSNFMDGTLSVLISGQLGTAQTIAGLGRPQAMAFDKDYQRLYVADEEAQALTVINVVSNQIIGRISLGAKPLDLAVVQ
jgi:YVTN family beta-propeller protein